VLSAKKEERGFRVQSKLETEPTTILGQPLPETAWDVALDSTDGRRLTAARLCEEMRTEREPAAHLARAPWIACGA
jgi:hypothetical protein